MPKIKYCHCPLPTAGYSSTPKSSGFVSRCQKCGKFPKNTHKSILKKAGKP